MVLQQNLTLVKKLFDEVYSKGNIAALDQLCSSDVRLMDAASPNFKGGLAAYKERETAYKTAFPARNIKIDEIYSTDDSDSRVVVRWTFKAAHKGNLMDVAPTGKNVTISGISIFHIANGKITEITQSWDRLGLLEQIGEVETSVAALHS